MSTEFDPSTVAFNEQGLVPAIAQDHRNGAGSDDGLDE